MFWTKDTWILPIHRPSPVGHWVLCITHLPHRELCLFDSLAEEKGWPADIEGVMKLITQLLNIASKKHPGVQVDRCPWIACPTTIQALQTNDYDCGVWVLATVAAILRGHDAMGLKEGDMLTF
ncbi:hypothetical protein SCLCIDRAFT_20492 [Scleroderma citrinum Foug A]|uniref:Ubiquitin-like protease family profile domain-containing protein n=1 Tax=Scleroderma citrinum Foug A TaxID=1036808 RepID=A0A0C3EID6_9AGAM|nr:hypothetical protein SCLCIDRAFT_20492 [Scleroderma citrinum Foug A]